MTKDELRRIFNEAEKEICTPEFYDKLIAEIKDLPDDAPEIPTAFAVRLNRTVEREILLQVLLKVLEDK